MAEGSGWRAKSGREAALYSRYRSTKFGLVNNQILIRRPLLGNLLHKLFSRYQAPSQSIASPVRQFAQGLRREVLQRDRSSMWFSHGASSLDHLVRSR